MDKYRRVEKPKEALVKDEDEIRVTAMGSVSAYVSRAATVFNELKKEQVVIKATGNALTKAVTLAEVVKRRFKGLHQITSITNTEIVNEYEPLEEGLDRVSDTRTISVLEIKLSKEPLDTSDKGYQAPVDESLVTEFDSDELTKPRGRGRGKGSGRGSGRGRGKGRGNGKGKDKGKGKGKSKSKADDEVPPASKGKDKGKGKGKGKGKSQEAEEFAPSGKAKGKGKGKAVAFISETKGGKGSKDFGKGAKGKGSKGSSYEVWDDAYGVASKGAIKGGEKGKSKGKGKGKSPYEDWDTWDDFYSYGYTSYGKSKGGSKGGKKGDGKGKYSSWDSWDDAYGLSSYGSYGKGKGKDQSTGKGKEKGKGKGKGKDWY